MLSGIAHALSASNACSLRSSWPTSRCRTRAWGTRSFLLVRSIARLPDRLLNPLFRIRHCMQRLEPLGDPERDADRACHPDCRCVHLPATNYPLHTSLLTNPPSSDLDGKPFDWAGPAGIFLPLPALVFAVGTATLLGCGSLYLLSNL